MVEPAIPFLVHRSIASIAYRKGDPMHTVLQRRSFTYAVLTALLVHVGPLSAQPTQDSYYVNDGDSAHNPEFAESATDLGGHIPFEIYDSGASFWESAWVCGGTSVRQTILDNFVNLRDLDADLRNCTNPPLGTVFPKDLATTLVQTQTFDPWWVTPSTNDYLTVWDYRINDGYVQIVRRTNPPTQSQCHFLFTNYARHESDFSSVGFMTPGNLFFPKPWQPSSPKNLDVEEQALERGDIVVRCREQFSASIWIALQRTQEAEYFVRDVFFPATFQNETPGDSFLHGGSWGALVSGIYAMLQGNVYRASASTFPGDFTYHFATGDFGKLQAHYHAGAAAVDPEALLSDTRLMGFFPLIDALGIRPGFKHPDMQGWGLAAFSQIYRKDDLKAEIHGFIGAEDPVVNHHWQSSLKGDPEYQTEILQFTSHEAYASITPGTHEYSVFTGNEWSNLIAASAVGAQAPLEPTSAPPAYGVDPDPYTSTLRQAPSMTDVGPAAGLLAQEWVINQTTPPDPNAPVPSIGQGVWPGRFDSMGIDDLDGDGEWEVFFGNLDGYFHVLQLVGAASTNPTLVDEWRSPVLGWGLWTTAHTQGTSVVHVADSQGQIHKIKATGPNAYESSLMASGVAELGDGYLPAMYRADFHDDETGNELLVLNEELDWVLLDRTGMPLLPFQLGVILRDPKEAVAAGQCAIVSSVPGKSQDGDADLLVPSLDGHLWFLERRDNTEFEREEVLGFTDRALYRVEPIDNDTDGVPDHLLLFGRNDSLPAGEENRIMLYAFASDSILADLSTLDATTGEYVPFDSSSRVCFAWAQEPTKFVVGGDGNLAMFQIDLGSSPPVTRVTSGQLPPPLQLTGGEERAGITSIVSFPLPSQPVVHHFLVATENGRIWYLDHDLQFRRTSDQLDPYVVVPNPAPWYSNHTVGHEFAVDSTQDGQGGISLFLAEFQEGFRTPPSPPPLAFNQSRMARLDVPASGSPVVWVPDTGLYPARPNNFARTLIYQDVNLDGSDELITLAEVGVAINDAGTTRTFCNVGVLPGTAGWHGGHLFECFSSPLSFQPLTGFFIPPDSTGYYLDNGTGPNADWWHPRPGAAFISGQIAHPQQGHTGSSLSCDCGTSMVTASLPDDNEVLVPHLVTGTVGGNVYGLEVPANPSSTAGPRYISTDLGWSVMGMDAGNLDADPEDEVVVGSWIDAGTFEDWTDWKLNGGSTERNRGALVILDADPINGGWTETRLNGDDLMGPHGGLGTGVFGIKIDNVDGAGDPEIWAGDAAGHLYLLQQTSPGQWSTVYRSASLGAYPGIHNNLFPMKEDGDPAKKTVGLVLVSPGYVKAFQVDSSVLGSQ